jgi:AP-2 complex subunit alpha
MTGAWSSGGKNYSYALKLPILPTQFFEGVALTKDVYMQRWKQLEGADKEVQEIFSSVVTPLNPNVVAMIKKNVFAALHITIAEGMDNDLTITGCGTFKTGTMGPDGTTPIVVGAMVRVEADVNGGRFRITVRSSAGSIAQALRNSIKVHLASA